MEIDSDGKFNIYGDFVASEGIYNFRDLALIDKKFELKKRRNNYLGWGSSCRSDEYSGNI